MHARFERGEVLALNWPLLQAAYHDDDISGRIIDTIPEHMFRRGWNLSVDEDKTRKLSKKFEKYARKLNTQARMKSGATWGGLFGGCLLILGIDDDRPLDQPVNEEAIKSIKYINVFDRRYARSVSWYTNPMAPNHGETEVYELTNPLLAPSSSEPSPSLVRVHSSRVIRWDGANTDPIERRKMGGWDHSVLQRPYEKIKAFVQAFQASGNLLTDASQGVYKLSDLMSQIGANEVEALQTRLLMMDFTRSVARAIVLDKEGEEFERTVASITGYPEMLDRFMMLLSAATEIPVTILMGRSAAGMNATGDNDFRTFYSKISSRQVHELEPRLQTLYRYISLAKDGPSNGVECDFTFTFRSLWEPTLVERADINFTQAQADNLNIQAGVVTKEEVAISRFSDGGELNLTTTIDLEGRHDALEDLEAYDPYENDPDAQAAAQAAAGVAGAEGTKVVTGVQTTGNMNRSPRRKNSQMPGNK